MAAISTGTPRTGTAEDLSKLGFAPDRITAMVAFAQRKGQEFVDIPVGADNPGAPWNENRAASAEVVRFSLGVLQAECAL